MSSIRPLRLIALTVFAFAGFSLTVPSEAEAQTRYSDKSYSQKQFERSEDARRAAGVRQQQDAMGRRGSGSGSADQGSTPSGSGVMGSCKELSAAVAGGHSATVVKLIGGDSPSAYAQRARRVSSRCELPYAWLVDSYNHAPASAKTPASSPPASSRPARPPPVTRTQPPAPPRTRLTLRERRDAVYARFARQEAVRRAREAAERDRVSAARRRSEERDRSTPASRSTVTPPAAVSTTPTPAVATGGPAAAAGEKASDRFAPPPGLVPKTIHELALLREGGGHLKEETYGNLFPTGNTALAFKAGDADLDTEVHFTTTQGGRRVFERVLTYSRGRLEKIEDREADATNPKANASEATFMYSDGKAYSRIDFKHDVFVRVVKLEPKLLPVFVAGQ